MPNPNLGLYCKYFVSRVDGRDAPGEKHFGCVCFVLDINHDPNVREALRAYAFNCATTLPKLSEDLLAICDADDMAAEFARRMHGRVD